MNQLEKSLSILAQTKTRESAFAVAKDIFSLLGISENISESLFLDSDGKLQKNNWTEKDPRYENRPAAYEMLEKNSLPLDGKLYFVDKISKQRIQNLVALMPNYEDNPAIFLDKNVGIDLVVDKECAGITIVLTKNYSIRSLTLEGKLSNTQKTILEKWMQSFGVPSVSDKYSAEWKKKIHSVLWESFDISEVNKAFYKGIAELFVLLVQHITKQGKTENFAKQFANRLLGRLIFCWFLDKKHFLNPQQEYLNAKGTTATEFYQKKLQKLFFLTLNLPQSKRSENIDALVGGLDELTPYLNGGLFEKHEGDEIFPYETDFFPSNYFEDLFDFFNHYHFTTDENTTDYQAVAIDPEMLGRIFENLLAEQTEETGEQARKAKGAFYTPREIVEYMCQESLWESLKIQVEERDQKELYRLLFELKGHEFGKTERESIVLQANRRMLLEKLDTIKIIDPAVGSGAFPMGMLQLMLEIYFRLDGGFEVHKTKLQIIKENLFGVDIEPMAVEICRLRAWLSIMVEEKLMTGEPNSGIHPLPNLDFKFVCANSLIPLPKEKKEGFESIFDDFSGTFEKETSAYFDTTTPEEKVEAKQRIKKLIGEKVQEKISDISSLSYSLNTEQKFSDVVKKQNSKQIEENSKEMTLWASYEHLLDGGRKPVGFFETKYFFPNAKDGFDIVIGNPPYVQLQKFARTQTQKDLENAQFKTFAKTGDLYGLFYEKGLEISKKNSGILCFITSNKWMRAGYGEKLRKYFSEKTPKKLIDFGGFKVFETATVDTNILIIKNLDSVATQNFASLHACHFQNDYQKGDSIKEYFAKNSVEMKKISTESWFIGDNAEVLLKEKIEKNGIPLKDWGVKIYRGILTGLNEAFIVDEKTKDELIANDPKSAEILKPILRGRDIKRYGYEFGKLWLIVSHNGFGKDENGEKKVKPVNMENFPAVKQWLDGFGEKLSARGDKGETPYNLRDCAYMEEFEKEKIVWQEMSKEPCFSYDNAGIFCNDTARILTGEKVKFFVGFFNSKFFQFAYSRYYSGGRLGGEGIRYKSEFMKNFPIPKITPQNQKTVEKIEELVEEILALKNIEKNDTKDLEQEIDELVFALYGLTEEEIGVVLGKQG